MTPVFLDVEASSLSKKSHPIEIGCAWIEDGCVLQCASLIRPHPTWAPDWSAESAAVHGIDRGALDDAEPTENVARRFSVLLAGRTIVSDAPEFDGPWLGRLLSLLPDPPSVRLVDIDAFLHLALSREGQRAAYASLAGSPTPHRAGGDAARLANAWLAAMHA
jgi:DNA polymerase III epsilon subunit-like protein